MPGAKSLAEYDSPFYGEGAQGFRDTADRGGRSAEELAFDTKNQQYKTFLKK